MITTINPKNGKTIDTYEVLSSSQVERSINSAHDAFHQWSQVDYEVRSKLLHKVADLLEHRKRKYAALMTEEMGKLHKEAEAEIEKCAWVCRYYADNGQSFLADEYIDTDARKSYISYRPLGVILAVMPWNYPFWQVFRFLAPTLLAGNTALLKHASNVPGCGSAISQVIKDAGFPENVFQFLLIKSDQVESIIRHKHVKAVTLTGSEPAGKAVASTAASEIKKSVLELGGSDPYIVMADADLDLAVDMCTTSRLKNCGQSCIGAKRFIVHESVYDEFLSKCKEIFENINIGDPEDENSDMGPMAKVDLRDELHEQVMQSVEKGASCITGGTIPDRPGAYYLPTILTEVKPGMPAYEEELFGPVASVFKFKEIDEAINLANDTHFGLGACIFSKDVQKAEDIARNRFEAGSCFVNAFVQSDPRLPFGGINRSGFGRELSYLGIREFTNIKTLYIK